MPAFSITWPQPGVRIRIIIVIVVYVATFYLAPHETMPLAIGSLLGGLLMAEPARSRRQLDGPQDGR